MLTEREKKGKTKIEIEKIYQAMIAKESLLEDLIEILIIIAKENEFEKEKEKIRQVSVTKTIETED